jgi:hypothetical protein
LKMNTERKMERQERSDDVRFTATVIYVDGREAQVSFLTHGEARRYKEAQPEIQRIEKHLHNGQTVVIAGR